MKYKDDERGHVFHSFIRDCCSELRVGHSVVVFFDYQYMELQKKYGDKLEIKYDERNEWWVCKLKDKNIIKKFIEEHKNEPIKEKKQGKKRHRACIYDIPLEECYELRQSGYTYKQLADKYGCGILTIIDRLRKYEEIMIENE